MDNGQIRSARLAAAILSYFESVDRGAPLVCTSLIADYPEYATELREFLEIYSWLEQLTEPLRCMETHALASSGVDVDSSDTFLVTQSRGAEL
jgi:hypothetical protein